MVSKDIVMGTIRRMNSSGVDTATIRLTLKDIGLSDGEIDAYFSEAGLALAPASPLRASSKVQEKSLSGKEESFGEEKEGTESGEDEDFSGSDFSGEESEGGVDEESGADLLEDEELHDRIAKKTAEKISPHLESLRSQQGMFDAASRLAHEEHDDNLSEIGEKLDAVGKAMPRGEHISELTLRLKALEELSAKMQIDVTDIKASSAALEDLLKKILDTNRKILLQSPKSGKGN